MWGDLPTLARAGGGAAERHPRQSALSRDSPASLGQAALASVVPTTRNLNGNHPEAAYARAELSPRCSLFSAQAVGAAANKPCTTISLSKLRKGSSSWLRRLERSEEGNGSPPTLPCCATSRFSLSAGPTVEVTPVIGDAQDGTRGKRHAGIRG